MANASAKTLLLVALVLCSALLTHGIRPEPARSGTSSQTQQAVVLGSSEQSCGEECLIRRTLAAQTDYIYTQKHKP